MLREIDKRRLLPQKEIVDLFNHLSKIEDQKSGFLACSHDLFHIRATVSEVPIEINKTTTKEDAALLQTIQ